VSFEILVSREARGDIAVAAAGFRDISPRLSDRFAEELDRVYTGISQFPEMYPLVYKNFRRALLRRFPYSVFYVASGSFILIMGVVHQSRDESTWKRRA
jgi:plasmid stabilization system protein ParE